MLIVKLYIKEIVSLYENRGKREVRSLNFIDKIYGSKVESIVKMVYS